MLASFFGGGRKKTTMILVQYHSGQEIDVCISKKEKIEFVASNMKFNDITDFRKKIQSYLACDH